MTERRHIWLFVGACLAVYAAVMFGFSFAIREPVKWLVDGVYAAVGPVWGLVIILAAPLLGGAWAMWDGRDYVPPPRAQLPRWLQLIGNAYLLLLGVGLAIVFAVLIIRG